MWEDPIVAEVRRTREELSAPFAFDVKAIFADLRPARGPRGGRLVSRKKPAEPGAVAVGGHPTGCGGQAGTAGDPSV
jgi:hypothetical protein